MICLDNSDWMRNGDYLPSRVEAQKDAAGLLCNDRLMNNPENTVGVLTTAGQGVDLLVSPTQEAGKVLACFSRIKLYGRADLITSIQIAQLALKHRKNKNGSQRIIVFVGCPVQETAEALQKLGKQLKKNNIAVDIISMGEVDHNDAKLQELITAANTNDNCHLISIPSGVSPVNALSSSPIMFSSANLGGTLGGGGDFGDFNPNEDPELAMVLRMSAEEARATEEARLRSAQEASGGAAGESAPAPTAHEEEDDEEAMMRRAIEMSMRDFDEQTRAVSSAEEQPETTPLNMAVDEDEDADLALALALSRGDAPSSATTNAPAAAPTGDFNDPEFVSQLLGTSDPNDPLVQAALAQWRSANHAGEEKKENDKKRKKDDE
jgi:26S proteasome regulatory subunit N10